MAKKTDQELMNSAVAKIHKAIKEAEALSEQLNKAFSLELCYGMGGTYYPASDEHIGVYCEHGWNSSSSMC